MKWVRAGHCALVGVALMAGAFQAMADELYLFEPLVQTRFDRLIPTSYPVIRPNFRHMVPTTEGLIHPGAPTVHITANLTQTFPAPLLITGERPALKPKLVRAEK